MTDSDQKSDKTLDDSSIEPHLMSVLSKKFEMITRDMTQSLLKSARSGVINIARDFSSAITLYDGRQLMIDEGLPVHANNIRATPEYTVSKFDDISPGDCYLTNSPYAGNTHHADYTLHVPVFCDGEPLFWTLNRAHQADIGAPEPSTYLAGAKDIYQEGTHFPSIRVQEDYEEREDIVRMCKLNIRVGETQWYGDFLGQVSAVRTGEEQLQDLCDEYGVELIKQFADEWIDYGERRMRSAIRDLPAKSVQHTSYHDPIHHNDAAPDGVAVTVSIEIDPDRELLVVDLRDNMENIPSGFNLCEATTRAAVYGGIFDTMDADLPHNQGSISRIEIKMDKGKIVGKPEYPVGTSVATTNVCDTLFNAVHAAIGQLGEPHGMAEGNAGMPPACAVISGTDFRDDDAPYVNQLYQTGGGGPAYHGHDGWLPYALPVSSPVIARDSVEIDEQKYPILVERNELVTDTGGPGKWRGAPSLVCEFGPRADPMTAAYFGNGGEFPPQGILGGESGRISESYKVTADGTNIQLPLISDGEVIEPGELIGSYNAGGGGYGNPYERDPDLVRADVKRGFVSKMGAREDYGVVLDWEDGTLTVDEQETQNRREEAMETEPS